MAENWRVDSQDCVGSVFASRIDPAIAIESKDVVRANMSATSQSTGTTASARLPFFRVPIKPEDVATLCQLPHSEINVIDDLAWNELCLPYRRLTSEGTMHRITIHNRPGATTFQMEGRPLETPGVAHTLAIPGQSFVLNAFSSNYGAMFITLKPLHERRAAELSSSAVLSHMRARLKREVPKARVLVFGAPAVRGLGSAGVRQAKDEQSICRLRDLSDLGDPSMALGSFS
jgi:hypothetical protein